MKSKNNVTIMWKLLGLVKPLTLWMIFAVITGVLGFLCASFITILGGFGLLEILGLGSLGIGLNKLIIFMFLLALLRGILHYIEHACNHYIAFKLLAHIRDKVFGVLRTLAPAKLDGVDKGNLIALVTSDIELLEIFFAHTISPICIALIMGGIMVSFIGTYHTLLGAIAATAYIVVGVILPIIMSKATKDIGELQRKENGEMNNYVLESLRGLKEIKQYNHGTVRIEEIKTKTKDLSKIGEVLKNRQGITTGITNSCVLFFSILMFISSSYLCVNGEIEFQGIVITSLSIFSSFGAFIALANLGVGLSQTLACGNRVLNLLEETPKVEEVVNGVDATMEEMVLSNVEFSYEDELILSDLNLNITPGKILGITGKSGCGKSTMLKLLMRFWDVSDGTIKMDQTNIKQIYTKSLRQGQSLVTQDTHLFSDSILFNIKLDHQEATTKEVIEACKKASIHEFIQSLPQAYETKVGELGDTLSGGERQRIGLARAFLHNRKCLFLDEPTSNLDSLNEAVILKALKADKERTTLLVSHRASTMKVADEVINMESKRKS